ncbi:Crp/Fnr family transcriptional regulator [Brevibacterium daeguense]|uniref:Crp/Fnr family transcriptional regulator n=1 Tax=Brevibacterium daeguense TaxID=909936 RepID=A0ABP8EL51_9MICO|nr:Crp/Fnr family transcriptional regulator [Brevibacterium daeguense]
MSPVHSCVSRVPIFAHLTAEQQQEVTAIARPTTVTRHERLYSSGDDVSQLMVLHEGLVTTSSITADGREHLLRVLEPGDYVGENSFLTGSRPDHDATAAETSRLCVFRHSDLSQLIARRPEIGLAMLSDVSRRLAETEQRLTSVTSSSVDTRLAEYLSGLPGARTPDGYRIALPLPKKDIASLLSTTPESLSRSLSRLAEAGAITTPDARTVVVSDPALLGRLAQS